MRIRLRIWLINFDADPDPDYYLMPMRIQVTKIMRIHNTVSYAMIVSIPDIYKKNRGIDPSV